MTFLILSFLYFASDQAGRRPASSARDLVGIEATFTNDFFINHKDKNPDEISAYMKSLAREVRRLCGDCSPGNAESLIGATDVIQFEDGFQFFIERDTRVVEVTATPIPAEDLHIHKKKIDLLIQAAHNIGLKPAKNTGGGHLHFDFHKFFSGKNQLLRDFLVDSYNHSFIFNSYFGANTLNAPTIDQLPESLHRSFIELIAKFDRSPSHIMLFIRSLFQSVYSKTMYAHLIKPQKYHAISLYQSLDGGGTVEFRNVRPYQQGNQVDLIAKAILARRDYLSQNPGYPLIENFSSNLSEKEKLGSFIKYLNEIDLDEKEYFPLLPKETISLVLERLTPIERKQYFIDYAKYTAFNDTDRQVALLDFLRKIEDDNLQKHILYILLEKTSPSSHFEVLIKNSDDLITRLGISPESFLKENSAQYSIFNLNTVSKDLDCTEPLTILLR